ncbi:MAG: hypothetical protein K6E76_08560 [Patescibacteria group bacterium]|nr:hypothetical protein [Patescibacteria group bacterium]
MVRIVEVLLLTIVIHDLVLDLHEIVVLHLEDLEEVDEEVVEEVGKNRKSLILRL